MGDELLPHNADPENPYSAIGANDVGQTDWRYIPTLAPSPQLIMSNQNSSKTEQQQQQQKQPVTHSSYVPTFTLWNLNIMHNNL